MIGKKGFAYTAFLVIVVLILLVGIITVVLSKENKFGFKRIGDIQLNALETYQNAEKTLFLIDQAAKYSGYKTVHELAESGGLYRTASECGDFLEYPIWYNRDKECYPGNIGNEFILTYNKNLNEMIKGFMIPESFVYTILKISPIKIAGVSKEMMEFPISYTTEKPIEKKMVCPLPDLVRTDTIGVLCTAPHCELREEVMKQLGKAMQRARDRGFELQVTYAYRTIEEQIHLRATKGELAAKPSCSAPHITGGAVDIILKGQPYMGSKGNPVANMKLGDRKALEEIMCDKNPQTGEIRGFVRYGNTEGTRGEFWHYEYGTTRWERGKAAKVCAII